MRFIQSQTITTKRELIKWIIKVWFYNGKITRYCKTFTDHMPDRIKVLKASKGGQTEVNIELLQRKLKFVKLLC